MKKTYIPIIFIALFAVIGCGSSGDTNKADNKTTIKALQPSARVLNPYQIYIEEVLSDRTKAFDTFKQVKDKDPLSGADLDSMSRMLVRHLNIKDKTEDYIKKYQYLVDNDDNKYTSKERFELVMISLSAMLARYDDYLLTYKNFNDQKNLREFLNDPNSSYGIPKNVLQDITNKYNSTSERKKIKKMINFYKENKEEYKNEDGKFFLYLKDLIENSPSYKIGFDDTTKNTTLELLNVYNISVDLGDDGLDLLINEISKDFGNSAGLVATRKGKLYGNDEVASNIRNNIKAGDFLLEKTPFRLTDKLIPGHWGHAAVYLGTNEELEELGVWEKLEEFKDDGDLYFTQDKIDELRKDIQDGKVIDEALRDGVQLNTIEHFLNIDDLAIMHDTTETKEDKIDRIILTMRQLGKEYDFKFDVETSVKIVCSELIYATDILHSWPTKNSGGIYTISPDNVASKSIEDETIYIIPLLYHDGKEIKTDRKAYMKGLLDGSIK